MEHVDVVVIGAGPGGLGASGLLTEAGLRTVLLERGPGVGAKWRAAYDRLHINTSTLTSHLPGMRFPRSVGRWPSRDELVSYYEDYAACFQIDVRTRVNVGEIHPSESGWSVLTDNGEIAGKYVVVATGRDGTPVIPQWPGEESFTGTLMHAARYQNASEFKGMRALVAGVGNSGADISVDLLDGGAASVHVAIRTAPHIVRRTVGGVPNDVLQVLTRRLPTRWVDFGGELVRRRAYGDLEPLGLGRPPTGVKTYVKTQSRVPTIDAGPFSDAVRKRRIRIVDGLTTLDRNGAVLEGGLHLPVDLIVAATGYRPNLEPLIGHLDALSESGRPMWAPQLSHPRFPGLFVMGFGDPTRGNLRGLRMDAIAVKKTIVDSRRSANVKP